MTDQLRIFAGLQGFVSAAGLLALLLFFALATPFGAEQGRWAWLGPVNDWLYVLGAAPWIVASVLLVVRVRGGALLWVVTRILCILIATGAIVTALTRIGVSAILSDTSRWSHPSVNMVAPYRWQATRVPL